MFWIALELSIPKIGFKIMLSLTFKKLDAFKFDGVAESDNTGCDLHSVIRIALIAVLNINNTMYRLTDTRDKPLCEYDN